MMNWIKKEFPDAMPYPQYPNFCGIASTAGVVNSILNKKITQEDLHHWYSIGSYSKLNIPTNFDFKRDSFKDYKIKGMGMSNWDIIRLFNAVMKDHDHTPYSLVLAGKDFIREVSNETFLLIRDWLNQPNNHVIVHKFNHYMILAGHYLTDANELIFLCSDPGKKYGPVSSISLQELKSQASTDKKYSRYGFVLLSDQAIPTTIFAQMTEGMLPKESINGERFDRI